MISAFAMFPPEGLTFEKPDPNRYKYKKHAEIALYAVPRMLNTHSSTKLYEDYDQIVRNRKHKRHSSIILPAVGILMNANKTVSFAPSIEEKTYKHDKW